MVLVKRRVSLNTNPYIKPHDRGPQIPAGEQILDWAHPRDPDIPEGERESRNDSSHQGTLNQRENR